MGWRGAIGRSLLTGWGAEKRQSGFEILRLPLHRQRPTASQSLHQNGEAENQRQDARQKSTERNHRLWVSSLPEKRKRSATAGGLVGADWLLREIAQDGSVLRSAA